MSIAILTQAAELQRRKSADYQSADSTVVQADYYPNGVATIQDIIWGKVLRARSLIEGGKAANFESLEDTYLDIINYASFAVAYLRGGVPGQDFAARDAFNKARPPVFINDRTELPYAFAGLPPTYLTQDEMDRMAEYRHDSMPCVPGGENRRPDYVPGSSMFPINKTGVA